MLIFKCPDCDDSTMGFNEATEIWACDECDHNIDAAEATTLFESGELIGLVESDDEDDDDDKDDKKDKKPAFGKKKDDDSDDKDDDKDDDDKDMKKEESFNGFDNQDTWTVNLVVQNEYKVQKKALATIREADEADQDEKLQAYVENTVAKDDHYMDILEDIDFDTVAWNEIVESLEEAASELDQITTDLENALGVNEDMSEEDRTVITTVFESALTVKYNELKNNLEEKHAVDLEDATQANFKQLTLEMSGYLDEAIAEWMEENKLVIEHAIQTEMTNSFMEGLQGLLSTHYIDVPEDRFDVLEDMAEKVEELDNKLSDANEANEALQTKLDEAKKAEILNSLSEELTDTQVEKLEELAGSLDYESEDQFKTALTTLKESFLSPKLKKENGDVIVIDESAQDLKETNDDEKAVISNPAIAAAVRGLNRS